MKKKKTIPIYYIDGANDLNRTVQHAINSTFEENITRYFQNMAFNYALAGIDIYNLPIEKKIYFLEDESK